MPRINLLPWREELRKERQKNFAIAAGIAVLAGVAVVLYGNWTAQRFIDHQNSRNQFLKDEIAVLDKQIEEILGLEAQKERLLARMEIIEQLQLSRPQIVHLFDELVKTVPDGVYLTSIVQNGTRLELKGIAQSNTRVSTYMRNIDASEFLQRPDLEVVETVERDRGRTSQFTVFAHQVAATEGGDGEGAP